MFSEAINPLLGQGAGENREPECHVSDGVALIPELYYGKREEMSVPSYPSHTN